jgi:hypothetical protein
MGLIGIVTRNLFACWQISRWSETLVVVFETSIDYASRHFAQDRLHHVILLGALCKASVFLQGTRKVKNRGNTFVLYLANRGMISCKTDEPQCLVYVPNIWGHAVTELVEALLQVWRSRVRVPIRALIPSRPIYLILPAALWPWNLLSI